MENRFIGIFVKDKFAARNLMDNMFSRGYEVTIGSFEGKKPSATVKVIPMDADTDDIHHRYLKYRFDEILIPSNISRNWENLAKNRLKDLNSIIKIYQP